MPEEAGVIGCGYMTSLWESVLLNAYFAHASELEDDSFYNGGVAWDITVVPLLLPMAQKLRISGKNLLEAIILGLEVHSRTAMLPSEHLGMCVWPGAVGPAAAAARALELNPEETISAFGLSMSAGPVLISNFGTDASLFGISFASSSCLHCSRNGKREDD